MGDGASDRLADPADPDGVQPLLQHTLGRGEPWRVVVTSMLLCRTRGDVAEPIIAEVFRRWPSPRRLSNCRVGVLERLITPLGFQRVRAARLRAAARFFEFNPRPPPGELARVDGVGKYVLDAYRLVVLSDLSVRPEDHALARWRREVTR
jgi:endonuclease III